MLGQHIGVDTSKLKHYLI